MGTTDDAVKNLQQEAGAGDARVRGVFAEFTQGTRIFMSSLSRKEKHQRPEHWREHRFPAGWDTTGSYYNRERIPDRKIPVWR